MTISSSGCGIAQAQAQHEAVELRLGQRERALVLDRVLGGDDQERDGHRVGDAVDRHLPLLHALEQRRLRLGRGPVDLVGEHDLGHDRARPELELLGLLVVDREAGHVGGQQVRRELDAPEGAAEAAREGLGQHRLADAGHVLDQQVALAQQRHQRQPHLVVLADDDPLDVGDDLLARFLDLGHWVLPSLCYPGLLIAQSAGFDVQRVERWYVGTANSVAPAFPSLDARRPAIDTKWPRDGNAP